MTTELDLQAEEAALSAAFSNNEPESRDEQVPAETQAEPEVKQEEEKTEQAAEDPLIGDRITLSQLENALSRFNVIEQQLNEERAARQQVEAKLHGKIGELNRKLLEANKAPQAQSGTPALDKFADDFPELVQAIKQDFGHRLTQEQPVETQKVEQAQPDYSQQLAEQRQQMIATMFASVEKVHPDTRDIIQSQAFQAWSNMLPQAEAQALRTTLDPLEAISFLNRFKEYRGSIAAKQQKQERAQQTLAAAAMPTTTAVATATPPLSEEDAMAAEFKRMRPYG